MCLFYNIQNEMEIDLDTFGKRYWSRLIGGWFWDGISSTPWQVGLKRSLDHNLQDVTCQSSQVDHKYIIIILLIYKYVTIGSLMYPSHQYKYITNIYSSIPNILQYDHWYIPPCITNISQSYHWYTFAPARQIYQNWITDILPPATQICHKYISGPASQIYHTDIYLLQHAGNHYAYPEVICF